MTIKQALLLVDLQNDFMPGGFLVVPRGDEVVPVANLLIDKFALTYATQDWHPTGHCSFASSHPGHQPYDSITWNEQPQTLWPDHCVEHTHGAALHSNLQQDRIAKIFHKGIDRNIESYSGFYDLNHARSTGLEEYLNQQNISALCIGGLATDYCVLYTVLASCELGFRTYVIRDLCRPINLNPTDEEDAYNTMRENGATIITVGDLPPGRLA